MSKDPRVYLAHILECAGRIEQYVSEGKEAFLSDTMVQDAVIRNLEVIGEAVKRVPDAYRLRHPDIPWKRMAGFRDILIHDYQGVNVRQVWKIATDDLPPVREAIANLLPRLEELERELAREGTDGDEDHDSGEKNRGD